MNKSLMEILESFQDLATGRCTLQLIDGQYYEGYLLEITEEYVIFGEGGYAGQPEDLRFALTQIDLNKLSYFDTKLYRYRDVYWDETQQSWQTYN